MTLPLSINDLEKGKFRDGASGSIVAVTSEDPTKFSIFDTATSIIYAGEAARGSLTSQAVWKITKIDTASSTITFKTASDSFDQIWDDRASLTYV